MQISSVNYCPQIQCQPLLLPSDISANLSMPEGTKKSLFLSMDQVQLCITPSIVRVLLGVLSDLKPKEASGSLAAKHQLSTLLLVIDL